MERAIGTHLSILLGLCTIIVAGCSHDQIDEAKLHGTWQTVFVNGEKPLGKTFLELRADGQMRESTAFVIEGTWQLQEDTLCITKLETRECWDATLSEDTLVLIKEAGSNTVVIEFQRSDQKIESPEPGSQSTPPLGSSPPPVPPHPDPSTGVETSIGTESGSKQRVDISPPTIPETSPKSSVAKDRVDPKPMGQTPETREDTEQPSTVVDVKTSPKRPFFCPPKAGSTPTVKAICADEELWALDGMSVALYKQIRTMDSVKTQAKRCLRKFLKAANRCTSNAQCLKDNYRNRIEYFQGVTEEGAATCPI